MHTIAGFIFILISAHRAFWTSLAVTIMTSSHLRCSGRFNGYQTKVCPQLEAEIWQCGKSGLLFEALHQLPLLLFESLVL
jgi:hypothetical protein